MSELVGACLIGQSGGPTAVINSSAYGVIKTALGKKCITKVLAAQHGIRGILDDSIIDMGKEDAETLELVHLTDSDARLGEAVATHQLVTVGIGKDELHRGIVFDIDPFRSVYIEHDFGKVGTAEVQVEGAERGILNEFGEMVRGIRQGLDDNALDLAALVAKGHDELVGFDGDRALGNDLRGFCSGRVCGLLRFARNDVCAIGGGSGHFGRLSDLVRCRSTENRGGLDFGRGAGEHESVCRRSCGGIGNLGGSFLGGGLLRKLRLFGSLVVRRVHEEPPNHDGADKNGSDDSILVHLFSFLGGTGS